MDSLVSVVALGLTVGSIWGSQLLTKPSVSPKPQPPASISSLFSTKSSLGSIAVGHAEGNMDTKGNPTHLTNGHTDPGNGAFNRGFCSWNRANGLSLAQADAKCLAALQSQSQGIITDLKAVDINPTTEIIINGTDLSNQSPRAGKDFAAKYRDAVKAKHPNPILDARIKAFEVKPGVLSATGLFRICRTYGHYSQQLQGLSGYEWDYQCIGLDQRRRVEAIKNVLASQAKK